MILNEDKNRSSLSESQCKEGKERAYQTDNEWKVLLLYEYCRSDG